MDFSDQHRAKYVQAVSAARLKGPDSFQAWFNTSRGVYQSVVAGYWDFAFHILTPGVIRHLREPEQKVALEIGYGGGRLINAACSFFRKAIGVDIHAEEGAVETFLREQGKHNYQLVRTDGESIPLPPESVDFVYSFIVLQHLPTFQSFKRYLADTFRCLKNNGVAQLYFGRFSRLNPFDFLLHLSFGYKEIRNADVNCTSLVISPAKVKRLCRDLGFKIIDCGPSYKDVPTGFPSRRGGQNYVTLLKP